MNTELIALLKSQYETSPEKYTGLNKENPTYKEFLSQFPLSSLTSISLDDYCMGGERKQKNFCWWIEVGLQPVFGTYSAGSARSHIIFKQRKDGVVYKNRRLKDMSDDDALKYVLKITKLIAEVPDLEKAEGYDDDALIYNSLGLEPRVTMGDARKLRIYNIYHPDASLDINSPRHFTHFLALFHVKHISRGVFGKAKQLWDIYVEVEKELPGLSPRGFARLLYSKELGLSPGKEASVDSSDQITSSFDVGSELPMNTIFYGPPGTGKTYATVDRSLQILDPDFWKKNEDNRELLLKRFRELKDQKRIGFVTFHQSFSYEEFVEGLKANRDDDGQISYQVEDGIFKIMCESALSKITQKSDAKIDLAGKNVWKISLGNTLGDDSFIYDECIENNCILIGYGAGADYSDCHTREDVAKVYKGADPEINSTAYPVTDPPPINESMAGVNPANVWTIYRSEDNGKKTLYGGANHRIFAPSGSDDRARQNDGRSAA